MALIIDKNKFDASLSVAISADDDMFSKLSPAIERSRLEVGKNILGPVGMAEVEKDDKSLLAYDVVTYICVDAFLNNFRQLDLVLTTTGFGVVSNNSISPASKARVDALEKSLRLIHAKTYGSMLENLREVKGWGDTHQAKKNISTPFYNIFYVDRHPSEKDLETWNKMQSAVADADFKIRKLIGNEQMEDIMRKLRNNTDDVIVCDVCRIITEVYRMEYYHSPVVDDKINFLMNYIENYPETFNIYMNSKEYQGNHYEGFQNEKDSSAYIFLG